MVGISALALAAALWPSDRAEAVAAFFPPVWSQATAFEAASGAAERVSLGRAPFVVVARSQHPGLAGRLRRSGAWLVLNINGADCSEGSTKQP